jgi:transposase-like protein
MQMNRKELEAFAKEAAKGIKTPEDLNDFSRMLKKITVEAALNAEMEGAKFWLSVLTELQHRGVEDILIACVDGLKGFPDAINAVFPQTHVQLCIVHMVRNSLKYVSWKDYKAVTTDLKSVYRSSTEEEALHELERFSDTWDEQYPQISKSWRAHWQNLNTILNYPGDIRKAIYTTNAIESLNSVIRKALKKRKIFPSDIQLRKWCI